MTVDESMKKINKIFHDMIDGLNPNVSPISDEFLLESDSKSGLYYRDFHSHTTGKNCRMKWRVYYGTPETVVTIFEKPLEL